MTMNPRQKMYAIGGAIALVVIVLATVLFFRLFKTDSQQGEDLSNQAVAQGEPLDIALDFYDEWLTVAQSTSTNPYDLGLPANPILSPALKAKVEAGKDRQPTELDPVLCQLTPPEKIKAKVVFQVQEEAQILIKSSGDTPSAAAVVSLAHLNDGWYIKDIECSQGETAPEREFSFDNEGFILKGVPPQLDANTWYIVFEEDGQKGHYVPLTFNGESMCKSIDGNEAVCAPDQFLPVAKAHVYGQMGDLGAEVKKIEFLQ